MNQMFVGEKEKYEVSLLPDLHGKVWLNRLSIVGQSSGHKYVLSQQKKTLEWQCSCRGWIFSLKRLGYRDCDHIRATGLKGLKEGENPPQEIIDIIGDLRWYAQQAARFGKVNLAD